MTEQEQQNVNISILIANNLIKKQIGNDVFMEGIRKPHRKIVTMEMLQKCVASLIHQLNLQPNLVTDAFKEVEQVLKDAEDSRSNS